MEETDDRGRKTRTTEARDNRRGIPQGSPISPLLANLYMRRFVLGWKKLGLERSLGSHRDLRGRPRDPVQERQSRRGVAATAPDHGQAQAHGQRREDTSCKVPEGKFDFLGYTFGRMYSARTGKAYLGYRPSRKSIKRMVENVHALTVRAGTWQETTGLVKKLNRTLRGWANYFEVGTVTKAYRALDNYTAVRLRRWLLQAQGQATQGRDVSTLAPLRVLRARAPVPAWARRAVGEGVKSSESRMREIFMSGSMRGMWETESWLHH